VLISLSDLELAFMVDEDFVDEIPKSILGAEQTLEPLETVEAVLWIWNKLGNVPHRSLPLRRARVHGVGTAVPHGLSFPISPRQRRAPCHFLRNAGVRSKNRSATSCTSVAKPCSAPAKKLT